MIKSRTVKEDDTRPMMYPGASKTKCGYCNSHIGEDHEEECVCWDRTVVVDFTFRVIVRKPVSWDVDSINFHLNDSSWCADNAVSHLKYLYDSDNMKDKCACDCFTGQYVREATEEDEERYDSKDSPER